jgi:hypothetical protein
MNIAIAVLLLAHGLAHVVGFVSAFGLMADKVPPMTTVFGGHVADPWIRIVGASWAVVGIAFAVAAAAAIRRTEWWPRYTAIVALASLVLCAAGAPETRIGTIVNFAIIIAVATFVRWPWRAHV